MDLTSFFLIFGLCTVTMLACRVLPLLLLKGRDLPPTVVRALGFIPPAAFAALIANDLFKPELFSGALMEWLAPLVSAVLVGIVGVKTKSMAGCIVVGVASMALLGWLPGVLGA